MKKPRVVRVVGVLFVLGAVSTPAAHATTLVERAEKEVRARVCKEEYGYGVINCSETIDPYVDEVDAIADPVVGLVAGKAFEVVGDAQEWVQRAPGYLEEQVHYVSCWMLDPTNPEC